MCCSHPGGEWLAPEGKPVVCVRGDQLFLFHSDTRHKALTPGIRPYARCHFVVLFLKCTTAVGTYAIIFLARPIRIQRSRAAVFSINSLQREKGSVDLDASGLALATCLDGCSDASSDNEEFPCLRTSEDER